MLGEKVGRVSKIAFFILKNKVKIWTVWPFHSCITRTLVGWAAWGLVRARVPAGSIRQRESHDTPSSENCHGMALFIILPNHIFILKW